MKLTTKAIIENAIAEVILGATMERSLARRNIAQGAAMGSEEGDREAIEGTQRLKAAQAILDACHQTSGDMEYAADDHGAARLTFTCSLLHLATIATTPEETAAISTLRSRVNRKLNEDEDAKRPPSAV